MSFLGASLGAADPYALRWADFVPLRSSLTNACPELLCRPGGPRPPFDRGRGDPDPQSVFRWLGEGVPAGVRLQLEVDQLILAIPSPPADHG